MTTPKITADQRAEAERPPTTCFSVLGAADPGLLPRVVEIWAKRGLVPARLHSAPCGPNDGEVYIDIEVRGLTGDLVSQIACELNQIWGVSQVLTSFDSQRLSA